MENKEQSLESFERNLKHQFTKLIDSLEKTVDASEQIGLIGEEYHATIIAKYGVKEGKKIIEERAFNILSEEQTDKLSELIIKSQQIGG